MLMLPETALFVVGLMTAGTGLIFLWNDWHNAASRSLSACLVAIGLRLFLSGSDGPEAAVPAGWGVMMLNLSLESLAIWSGIEWGRRIGDAGPEKSRFRTQRLFRASQVLVLVYWVLNLGYLLIDPRQATSDALGVFRVRGFEFAIFAPILTASIVLAGIAIATLRASHIDPAEAVRLRALSIAGPFLLAALVFGGAVIPITLTIGLLFFLAGSVRYLLIQTERGRSMREFVSPEVAQLLQSDGSVQALRRERRVLSVVMCDLRGFTSYARERDSDQVVTLLERFYAVVGQVAANHGGTIKDHAGDGVLILVGAPVPLPDHADRAVRLALELMQQGLAMIEEAAPQLGLGIGLATGKTTVGAIRAARRLEYVAVGNAVNLAARLCDRAESGEILSDTRTVDALSDTLELVTEGRKPEKLKGFPEPIAVCALRTVDSDGSPGRRSRRRKLRPRKTARTQ